MPSYYGVIRSSEYLTHYGVKGMKWGVRRALERGSDRALARQYRKAERKLQKLTKLGVNKQKYARRAALYGTGAAALGGAALAGTSGVGSALSRAAASRATRMQNLGGFIQRLGRSGVLKGTSQGKAIDAIGQNIINNRIKANSSLYNAGNNLKQWGNQPLKQKIIQQTYKNVPTGNGHKTTVTNIKYGPDDSSVLGKITRNQAIRGVAALGAAGLGAAAARNAYRAATANRNIIKAAKWKAEMDRTFAGTKYANGIPATKRRRRTRG